MKSNKFLNSEHPFHWVNFIDQNDDDAMIPASRTPEDLVVMVAGGRGSRPGLNGVCHGWMQAGGLVQTRSIELVSSSGWIGVKDATDRTL